MTPRKPPARFKPLRDVFGGVGVHPVVLVPVGPVATVFDRLPEAST